MTDRPLSLEEIQTLRALAGLDSPILSEQNLVHDEDLYTDLSQEVEWSELFQRLQEARVRTEQSQEGTSESSGFLATTDDPLDGSTPTSQLLDDVDELMGDTSQRRETPKLTVTSDDAYSSGLPSSNPFVKRPRRGSQPSSDEGSQDFLALSPPNSDETMGEDQSTPQRTCQDDEEEPRISRKRGRRVSVSLTDPTPDGQDTRTNTLQNERPRPLTLMLWNVEIYGEHKALGNKFANRVIRRVVDEIDVDVLVLLETRSAPADVISGLEHEIADRMHTSAEKKKGAGPDIALSTRANAQRDQAIEKEETARKLALEWEDGVDPETLRGTLADEIVQQVKERVAAANVGPARFRAVASTITGAMKTLPERMGPYRHWPRGTTSEEKEGDLLRFKKFYSFSTGSTRPDLSWLLSHMNELADFYDLRFRVTPDYDNDVLSRPLTREEIAELRRCVESMSMVPKDLEYWDGVRRRHQLVLEEQEQFIQALREKNIEFDEELFRELMVQLPSRRQMNNEIPHGTEERRRITDLLLDLDRAAVLELKSGVKKASNLAPVQRQPRDVIGRSNETNSCYLNAVLQFLAVIPTTVLGSGEFSNKRLADAVNTQLQAAATQASDASYSSFTRVHPPKQTSEETNFVSKHSTRSIRDQLSAINTWGSTSEHEDASDALVPILGAFARENHPSPTQILASFQNHDELASIAPSPLHFYVRRRDYVKLDEAKDQLEAGSERSELSSDETGAYLERGECHSVLSLEIEHVSTFDAAMRGFTESNYQGFPITFMQGDVARVAPGIKTTCEIAYLPEWWILRVHRMLYTTEPTGNSGATVFKQTKITKPFPVPAEYKTSTGEWMVRAIIVHIGSLCSVGHYIAYVRHNRRWYRVDDRRVCPVESIDRELSQGYFYLYGPPEPPGDSSESSSSGEMDTSEDLSNESDSESEPETAIGKEVPFLQEILDSPVFSRLDGRCALPEPKEIDSDRIRIVQELLSEMIGRRVVETYTVLYRHREVSDSRGHLNLARVGEAELSAEHPNVGFFTYKNELLSRDANGKELGYQDPQAIINGRCPFYFELDIQPPGFNQPIRFPIVALHAPYGVPASFRSQNPKASSSPQGKHDEEWLPKKAKPKDFDGPDKELAYAMRGLAMTSLLDLGIPSYSGGLATPMREFHDGVIMGDFNLDMREIATNEAIGDAYRTLMTAGYQPQIDQVATTLAAIDTTLPARDSEQPSPESEWYSSAYDNIFVKSAHISIARSRKDNTPVAGVVDVFDFIVRHKDEFFDDAYDVVSDPRYYHTALFNPQTRARIETARWDRNDDDRARAYYLYRKFVSDHLPVFVDFAVHSDVPLKPLTQHSQQSSSPRENRDVVGLENHGSTCYLNAAVQMFAALGPVECWAVPQDSSRENLRNALSMLTSRLESEGANGSYLGDGTPFSGANSQRRCYSSLKTHQLRGLLGEPGERNEYVLGRQQDVSEVIDRLISGCARWHSDSQSGGTTSIDLSPTALLRAAETGRLATLLPGPLHFFVRTTWTYALGDQVQGNDGLRLDQNLQHQKYELGSMLRLKISETTTTLNEAWKETAQPDVSEDEPRRVVHQGVQYSARATAESLELSDPMPAFIFVQLKRFETAVPVFEQDQSDKYRARKLTMPIHYEEGLQLGDIHYSVIGIINHLGDAPTEGHYIAYRMVGKVWYKLNDSTVTKDPSDLNTTLKNGYVYLLRRD